MQFRDWGGMFMEHCHNTMHEDNAMLLRWEIQGVEMRSSGAADAGTDAAGVQFEDPYDLPTAR
jgi:hypothetical protein